MKESQISSPISKCWLPPVWVVRIAEKLRRSLRRLSRKLAPAPVNLMELVLGVWTSQAVFVAAKLGIPDLLADGACDYKILAQKTGTNPDALYRLLRALDELEILIEKRHGVLALTKMGACLKTDHPFSLRYMSIFQCGFNWNHWGQLLSAVTKGSSAVQQMRGESLFDYMKNHPEMNNAFDRAMTNLTKIEIQIFLSTYHFSNEKTIADLGGGQGTLIASILALHPEKRGILFDLPEVVAGAHDLIRSYGVHERCSVVGGSFFEDAPKNADLYILKNILHDWSDKESGLILDSIRKNIPATSKLLLLECIVPGPNQPHYAKILDLEMLVAHTGKERTAEEFSKLLATNGFRINRIIPTISVTSIIEAVPV